LEEHVLPQYFRHNRFQSLVRQLNFYSFRKINRDRKVWVYKHDLFHRDRPEDLHMVRRRTCPNGVDGRKQRIARASGRTKVTDKAPASSELEVELATTSTTTSTTDEDESSLETSSPASVKHQEEMDIPLKIPYKREVDIKPKPSKREPSLKAKQTNKRELEVSFSSDEDHIDTSSASNKRGRVTPPVNPEPRAVENQVVVVADVLATSSPKEETYNASLYTKDMTITHSPDPIDERVEMAQQSLIVSQVAKKLEKFARQAYGLSSTRPRRGGSGIVTPPFGTSRLPSSSSSLLTYDDEYEYSDESGDTFQPTPSVGAIADGDESTSTQDDWAAARTMVTPDKQQKDILPSMVEHHKAEAITERIENCKPDIRFSRDHIVTGIVASFAMHVSPVGNKDLTFTMYHLLNNNDELWEDFQLYRAALRPDLGAGKNASPLTLKQIFTGDAILADVVRDFKTFTVGCLGRILGKNGDIGIANQLLQEDREVLGRRADVWRMALHVAV
jgi:hypothetical protein